MKIRVKRTSEAAAGAVLLKKMLKNALHILQENTCVEVSF